MATVVSYLDSGIAGSRGVSTLLGELKSFRVEGLEESGLRDVLCSARCLQAGLEALVYRVGVEADRLAALGESAPAEEVLGNGGDVRVGTARREAARSRTVAGIAGLADAVGSGEVGVDHVDSLTRRLNKLTDEERSKIDEGRLVGKARSLPADRFDKAVKDEVDRARQDNGLKDAQQKRRASEFRHWFDHKTGMGTFCGQLDPERYESFTTAIDQHVATLAVDSGTQLSKDSALAATALAELVCTSPQRSRNLPHVTVVVDHDTLTKGGHEGSIRETGNGHSLAPETIDRLACDSVLQKVVLDERNVPINVGRKYRTATDAQWVAMRAIYSSCGWKDCDRPLSWCQLHHINEWQDGGVTNFDNLVPLCDSHHHRVHEGKWSIKLNPTSNVAVDRTLEIRRPDRRLYGVVDPPARRQRRETKMQI